MKIELNAAKLSEGLAMTLPCTGKDQLLPTLAAVALHYRDDGSVALVATNRYLLGEYVIPAEHVEAIDAEPCTILVPAATAVDWSKLAKRASKTWGSATPVTLLIEGETATLADYETSQSGRLIDGQHVSNYQRLFPTPGNGVEVAHVGLSPVNLAAVAKIATVAGKNATVRFDFTGEARGVLFRVAGVDAFRGLVMPCKVADWTE